MAFIDRFLAAGADEDVFRVIGQAYDLVGHHLADGDYGVEASVAEHLISLDRVIVIHYSFAYFAHKGGGDPAQLYQILSPVMDPEEVFRSAGIHGVKLLAAHRRVGAQGGQHGAQAGTKLAISDIGDGPGLGVDSGDVRRHCDHALGGLQGFQRLPHQG